MVLFLAETRFLLLVALPRWCQGRWGAGRSDVGFGAVWESPALGPGAAPGAWLLGLCGLASGKALGSCPGAGQFGQARHLACKGAFACVVPLAFWSSWGALRGAFLSVSFASASFPAVVGWEPSPKLSDATWPVQATSGSFGIPLTVVRLSHMCSFQPPAVIHSSRRLWRTCVVICVAFSALDC